jgi:hypothetical protein
MKTLPLILFSTVAFSSSRCMIGTLIHDARHPKKDPYPFLKK